MEPRLRWEIDVLEDLEEDVFQELGDKGIPSDEWPYYVGFVKRVKKIYRDFDDATAEDEITSLRNEYILRGWDPDILDQLMAVGRAYGLVQRQPNVYGQPGVNFYQASDGTFSHSYRRHMVTWGSRVWIFYVKSGALYVASADISKLEWTEECIFDSAEFPNYICYQPAVWQQHDTVGVLIETYDPASFWRIRFRFRRGTLNSDDPHIAWDLPWTHISGVFMNCYPTYGYVALAKTKTYWWASFQTYMVGYQARWYLYRSNDGGSTWTQVFERISPTTQRNLYWYVTAHLLPDGHGMENDNLDIYYGVGCGWVDDYYYYHMFHDGTTLYGPITVGPEFDYDPPGPDKKDKWTACKDKENRTWILTLRFITLPPHYVRVRAFRRTTGAGVVLDKGPFNLEVQPGWGIPWRHFSICYNWGDPERLYALYVHNATGQIKLWRSLAPFDTWTPETLVASGPVKTGANLIYYPMIWRHINMIYAEASAIFYGTLFQG